MGSTHHELRKDISMVKVGAAARPLIDSDQIRGTPVYSGQGERIGTIQRVIIDKAAGTIVYVVMNFVESLGLGDVTYVIPWAKLSYGRSDDGYHTHLTEADLRSAVPVAQEEIDWADRETGETFFSIPPGWRTI
jgi:hypothetical protein